MACECREKQRLMNALTYIIEQFGFLFSAIFIGHLLQKLTHWNASKTLAPFCWYRQKWVSLKWISHAECALSPPPKLLLWKMSDKRHSNTLQWLCHTFYWGPRLTIWLAWCQSVLSLQYLPASGDQLPLDVQDRIVTLPLTGLSSNDARETKPAHLQKRLVQASFYFHL